MPGQPANALPAGAMDFLKRAPIFVTAQAYREAPFGPEELAILQAHFNSWRTLLVRHGVIYDGVILDGNSEEYPELVYHLATVVEADNYPAALPLVLDALYDMTLEIPSADWEIHTVEQVVTRLEPDQESIGLVPGETVYAQRIKGLPALEEQADFPGQAGPGPVSGATGAEAGRE